MTRLRSFARGATNAIVGSGAYKHSGQGKHALQSVARDRDHLRSADGQLAAVAETAMGIRTGCALADVDRVGGLVWGGDGLRRRDEQAGATALDPQRRGMRFSRDGRNASR